VATMQDVANLANVSLATVSFTINNSKPVSPKTRAKVQQAMKDLGYRRNAVGSALARGRTHVLALLYPALQHRFSSTSVRFFTSAADQARLRGYNLVLWPMSNEAEAVSELTASGLVDGVILMEVQLDDPRVIELSGGAVPFALIGRTRDTTGISFVDVDFETTVEDAIDRLSRRGHTNLILIDGGIGSQLLGGYGPVARARKTFGEVTMQRGLVGSVMSGLETPAGGRALAREFVAEHPEVTGVLIMNEHSAPGFVAELKSAGYAIPRDISIISIASSVDIASMADPELAVLISPADELGRLGVDALIERIDERDKPLPQQLIQCSYSPGHSVGPAPKKNSR
jgi:DNA-binding LacI/PurR family transcriptional regulator